MHTGMLWFDNVKDKPLILKVQQAAEYYLGKYQRTPDVVLVNPCMFDADWKPLEGAVLNCTYHPGNDKTTELKSQAVKLTVRPYRPVLPGHIWIGIEDKN